MMKTKTIYITVCLLMLSTLQSVAQVMSDQKTRVANATVTRQGDQMLLSMDVKLDDLKLGPDKSVVLLPVLTDVSGERKAAFEPIVIDSHAQYVLYQRGLATKEYAGARHVKRHNKKPQTEPYTSSVKREPWMNRYKLVIEEDLCGCGDLSNLAETPILTHEPVPTMPSRIEIPLLTDDYSKIRRIEGRAFIDFELDSIRLRPDYHNNPEELKKILATIDEVKGKQDVNIDTVTIHGYASPEGTYSHNAWLAENRAATLRNHIQSLYHFQPGVIGSTSTPEDWAGLRAYVEKTTDMPERDGILALIDSPMEPDKKNDAIMKQYPERYKQLHQEVYPYLRHSDYVIVYSIKPYSLEQSMTIYENRPQDLSVAEFATLATHYGIDTDKGREILYKAYELNPDNERARLMAAQAAIRNKDFPRAEKILPAQPTSPQEAYLLGAAKKMQGKYAEAIKLMKIAKEGDIPQAVYQVEELEEFVSE